MLLIRAYYLLFAAIMFALAECCAGLSRLNKLLQEGRLEMPVRRRRSLASALHWHTPKPVLESFFRLRFRDHSA